MSKEIVSNGEDMVVEWVDRQYVGARRVAIKVSGKDGTVTIGDLVIDSKGHVTSSAPIALTAYSNTTRPAATSVAVGAQIFNTDDNAPNFSNGTNWYDASGNLT